MVAVDPGEQLLKLKKKAEAIANDPRLTQEILDRAAKKAQERKSALDKVWSELQDFFRMMRAKVSGDYTQLPWRSFVMIIAGLLYFLNPLDLIPDFIIGGGLVDDATVLAFIYRSLRKDLERFRNWEKGDPPAE